MSHNRTLVSIGLIEIAIGVFTIIGLIVSLLFSLNTKTPSVFIFVATSAAISSVLGIGILAFSRGAYKLLIYFSSIIVLSKILIFADIISLNGSLETTIAPQIKNFLSIAYHIFVIWYLKKDFIKKLFVQ